MWVSDLELKQRFKSPQVEKHLEGETELFTQKVEEYAKALATYLKSKPEILDEILKDLQLLHFNAISERSKLIKEN